MNITIIKEDNVVVVDGEALNFDFTLADNVWAIQWNGVSGEVEYSDGTSNLVLSDFSEYQYLADAHVVEKARLVQVDLDAVAVELIRLIPVEELRVIRDKLLAESDWTAVIDYPGADQALWLTYRQELRDMTIGYVEVPAGDIVWAVAP